MRTSACAKTTDRLGRYYTDRAISERLVACLPESRSTSLPLVDLGSGDGSLSVAAARRWRHLNLVTVDVDAAAGPELAKALKKSGFSGEHRHLSSDALAVSLPERLQAEGLLPTRAVCNPPFLVPKWRRGFGEILEDVGLSGCLPALSQIDSAAIFLAQNLRLLRRNGSLAIIVPDSVVSARKYLGFRKALLGSFQFSRAIRLPLNAFAGTEAQAHILVITKCANRAAPIELAQISSDGREYRSSFVDIDAAADRLDYSYHSQSVKRKAKRLGSIVSRVKRGSLNSAQARDCKKAVLHTTDIGAEERGSWRHYPPPRAPYAPGVVVAEEGDIVLARVGRNAAEKVIGIRGGPIAITDCLYSIRVPKALRNAVLRELASDDCARRLGASAQGVAAKHLSKEDLLNIPLDIK